MTSPYPKISVVTPSFNQGQFLEETLCSVLDQGYPNLEYIVIDGGSTDSSVEIIQKYAPHLAYWVSEKDSGQVEAIQKGLDRATGDVVAWLNSDDVYTPGTLGKVGAIFRDRNPAFLYGKCEQTDSAGNRLITLSYREGLDLEMVITHNFLPQPSCFWRRDVCRAVGPLNPKLHYAMDYEYWVRVLLAGYAMESIPEVLSLYRLHDASKTCTTSSRFEDEMIQVHRDLLQNKGRNVRRAVAACYRRFAAENYFWHGDRKRAIIHFRRMLATDPAMCDLISLKVIVKSLLGISHRVSGERATG